MFWLILGAIAVTLSMLLVALFRARDGRWLVFPNLNPSAGPLEFSEWPPPRIERLLNEGAEKGLWSPDLWNRELTVSPPNLLSDDFSALAEKIVATTDRISIEVEGATDESLCRLALLGECVEELSLVAAAVSDAALRHLASLTSVRRQLLLRVSDN